MRGAKTAHFCSMCGPKSRSVQISEEVREFANSQNQSVVSAERLPGAT